MIVIDEMNYVSFIVGRSVHCERYSTDTLNAACHCVALSCRSTVWQPGFGHPGTCKPTLKNPAKKNPVQNNQILMSNSTVIKKIFT